MSYSRNVPVVVEWSDEQKQVHIRDVDDTSPASSDWKVVCTCTDEAGAMAVGDLLTERAALREERDYARIEACENQADCEVLEGKPERTPGAIAEAKGWDCFDMLDKGVSDE